LGQHQNVSDNKEKRKKKKTSKENNLLPFTTPLSLTRMALFWLALVAMYSDEGVEEKKGKESKQA